MITMHKITDAGQAFAYYSDRDDYYLADKSSAEWFGAGGDALGLIGEIEARDFRDVLTGRFGDASVGNPEQHTPGWDVTFSAPKSFSIAALVNKDERLIKAHDTAVRKALEHMQRRDIVTRQRDSRGGYEWRATTSMVAGVVRHSTSRNLDPQLHSHAVVANMTRDPESGRWVSIDSRAAMFPNQTEAGNIYMAELARGAREAGYTVDWIVRDNGAVNFELREVARAEREAFSSRRKEVDAALEARGMDRSTASAEAREAATLDTRSPKQHVAGAELHARWEAQAKALGYSPGQRPPPHETPDRATAAEAAVKVGIWHLSERQTRFTEREILKSATTFARGLASQEDLAAAVKTARARGELVDRLAQVRGYSCAFESVAGFTTKTAIETEHSMLRHAASLRANRGGHRIGGADEPEAIESRIAARERATGHAMTTEQREAIVGVLDGDSGLYVIQGHAGTAKTTSVLATVAAAARDHGFQVRAIAPTHSAADTLGDAIGVESKTVAAVNMRVLDDGGKPELWIVDEAGMVSAKDMVALLAKADRMQAAVMLVGDEKQIGSVGAGSAFCQIKDAHPGETYELTEIKRQTSAELKQAVYDSIAGNFSDALGKVDVREIKEHEDAVRRIVDEYMRYASGGKDTLVVTLSRDDRDAVNAEIQRRLAESGRVYGVQEVATLRDKQWTESERADAARYRAGDVIEAQREYKKGPGKGGHATVIDVRDGRVTAELFNGKRWTFNPGKINEIAVLERGVARIGTGDRIVTKGGVMVADRDQPGRTATLKNNTPLTVEHIVSGMIHARTDSGRRVSIDARQGARIDLAYAQTANQAQGRTADVAISYMRSSQTKLADRQHAYVTLSRAKEHATVVTDDKRRLAETLERSARGKEAALDRDDRTVWEDDTIRMLDAAKATGAGGQGSVQATLGQLARELKEKWKQTVYEFRQIVGEYNARKWESSERKFIEKEGPRVKRDIHRRAKRMEMEIRKKFGTNPDAGALSQLFESPRQQRGRKYLDEIRAVRDQSLAKIDAAMQRAHRPRHDRAADEMQRNEQHARQRDRGGPEIGI